MPPASELRPGSPLLWKRIAVPDALCTETPIGGRQHRYAGDVRVGDLTGSGTVDFLVYRSVDVAHDEGGMKPCFIGAFTAAGRVLWQSGGGGMQPCRPGPVAVHDIDGDGRAEVITLFVDTARDPRRAAAPDSMADVVVRILDGASGRELRSAAPEALCSASGRGANWAHQRILCADFRGLGAARDFVVKLGTRIVAFSDALEVLWTYESPWSEYGDRPAYIPAVGDIDGDGRAEVNGGYFLLDHDGTPLWEAKLARHMDSVAIAAWDDGRPYAFCSGYGHVVAADGRVVLALGEELVPHGQELRLAPFVGPVHRQQMAIRYNGHHPDILVAGADGTVVRRLRLNDSTNNTGMEAVYWNGRGANALLYNGGMLWDLNTGTAIALPDLPHSAPVGRMAWYHCIAADVCGDDREELILYDPWSPEIHIYTPHPLTPEAYRGYRPTPRQYNPRLMD